MIYINNNRVALIFQGTDEIDYVYEGTQEYLKFLVVKINEISLKQALDSTSTLNVESNATLILK